MNNKHIFLACCLGLFGASSYGGVQQRKSQLAEKKQQLDLLSKQVTEQIELMNLITENYIALIPAIKEKKRCKLQAATPEREISPEEVTQACVDEVDGLGKVFDANKNKEEKYILTGTFFGNDKGSCDESGSIFKFYLMRHAVESISLCLLLEEWEVVQKEFVRLYDQLEIAKN
jgi:hypothetical protein